MLALHLLQISLVYINTLMIQQVLQSPRGKGRPTPTDLRALTPLKWLHVNPYGTFTPEHARTFATGTRSIKPRWPKFGPSLG